MRLYKAIAPSQGALICDNGCYTTSCSYLSSCLSQDPLASLYQAYLSARLRAGLGARLPKTMARRWRAGLPGLLPKEALLPWQGLLGRVIACLTGCTHAPCHLPETQQVLGGLLGWQKPHAVTRGVAYEQTLQVSMSVERS